MCNLRPWSDSDEDGNAKRRKKNPRQKQKAGVTIEEESETEADVAKKVIDRDLASELTTLFEDFDSNPTLPHLRSIVDKMPTAMLQKLGFEDLSKRLAGFSRLPKKTNLGGH